MTLEELEPWFACGPVFTYIPCRAGEAGALAVRLLTLAVTHAVPLIAPAGKGKGGER